MITENTTLMQCLSGSHAYGTSTPTSDTDIRGIFCAPKKYIVTPFFNVREMTLEEEEDGKLYELTNFMKLFTDQNPNILELGFVDKKDIISSSPAYDFFRQQAPNLLSKKVAFTFSGYAMSQMKRIKGHDKWINNPQSKEIPTQKEYIKLVYSYMDENLTRNIYFQFVLDRLNDLCVFVPMGNNIFGIIGTSDKPGLFNEDGSIRKIDYSLLSDEDKKRQPMLIVKYLSEEHRQAKEKHHNYWEWKNNRNEKRHELEVKYGYDTKHGSHLVRLMRMGEEILTEGKLLVKRPDAEELLAIRNGAWSYEKMTAWAEEKDEYIRGELYRKSSLPKYCNLNHAAEVLMEMQEMHWK